MLTTEFESLPIVDREQKTFVGTVVRVELEGGFYGIELPSTSGGIKYLPINIQNELVGKEGMEITVSSAFTKKDLVGFQMWGEYVYISAFSFILDASVKKDSIVSALNGKYLLGNNEYSSPYKINLGIYNLKNIPSNHPLFLENADESKIKLIGTTTSSGPYGTGYIGNALLYVYEDFGTISYKCSNHGYMGGQNNLVFDSESEMGYDIPTPTPTPTPTETPTPTPTLTPTPTPTPYVSPFKINLTFQSSVPGYDWTDFQKSQLQMAAFERWQEVIKSDRTLNISCILERPSIAWLASAVLGVGM